jgi:hypothetical protein
LVLTALLLLCCNNVSGNTPGTRTTPTVMETNSSSHRAAEREPPKPDAPRPKTTANSGSKSDLEPGAAGEIAIEPAFNGPVKPAITESYETPRQKQAWYGLTMLGHGAAAFDAWTTRRVTGGGYGVEGDPLERPFANSGAIYATTQVTPLLMDFVGRRMMRNNHPWVRKAWWVPQTASASVSLGAGIHNYRIVP